MLDAGEHFGRQHFFSIDSQSLDTKFFGGYVVSVHDETSIDLQLGIVDVADKRKIIASGKSTDEHHIGARDAVYVSAAQKQGSLVLQ